MPGKTPQESTSETQGEAAVKVNARAGPLFAATALLGSLALMIGTAEGILRVNGPSRLSR